MKNLKHRLLMFIGISAGITCALTFEGAPLYAQSNDYKIKRAKFEESLNYWRSFDVFINNKKQKLKYAKGTLMAKVAKDMQDVAKQERDQVIASLNSAADEFRITIQNEGPGDLKDQAQLSLAQTLFTLASAEDEQTASKRLKEALQIAKSHSQTYSSSPNAAIAILLQAKIYEALKESANAEALFAKVSEMDVKQKSDAFIYANLTRGDAAFAKEDGLLAMKFFERVLAHIDLYGVDRISKVQRVDTLFRLAWASYRAAKLEQAIGYARQVLIAPNVHSDDDQLRMMRLDSTEILGNSLFELNNESITSEYLTMKAIREYAPKISSTIIKRQLDAKLFEEVLGQIEFSMKKFPLSAEAPLWILAKIDVAKKLKHTDEMLDAEEHFVLNGVEGSAWISKNKKQKIHVQPLLDLLPSIGSEFIREINLRGIQTNNFADLNRASSVATILIRDYPHHSSVNDWLSARVKSLYYLERYAESCTLADKVLKERNLDLGALDDILYQRALCGERKWLRLFADEVNSSGKLQQRSKEELKAAASDMLDGAGRYADRFPNQSRAKDLLLLVASNLRDSADLKSARSLWERVLLANSSPSQRATSIRGLVYAAVEDGNATAIAELTERFLKLENWRELGAPLRNELLGVLASSTINAGANYAKNGQMLDAGSRLLRSAELVSDVPQREKLYRDGAYMLAVAGEWDSALNAADKYLANSSYRRFRGDFMYLKARALEFQMRFADSASQYLEYAKSYPESEKTQASLQRAEQLASSDEQLATAAESALLFAKFARLKNVKLAATRRAVEYYIKAKDTESAIEAAGQYRSVEGGTNGLIEESLFKARAYVAVELWNRAELAIKVAQEAVKTASTSRAIGMEASALVAMVHMEIAIAQFKQNLNDMGTDELSDLNVKFAEAERIANLVVASGIPRYMAESRYKIAEAAEYFANELPKISSTPSFITQSQRMKTIARRIHSDNALARMQKPSSYRDDPWSQLSRLKSENGKGTSKFGDYSRNQLMLSNDLPNQWSL